jgi:hypothetical protein
MDQQCKVGRTRAGRPGWRPASALALALSALGAGPPEILRVRAPSDRVVSWFPPGSELKGLGLAEFEDLVRVTRQGALRRGRGEGPRLVQARHRASWSSGVLIGQSEVVVEGPAAGSSRLVLEPWSPALNPAGIDAEKVGVDEGGRLGVRVAPGDRATVSLRWELHARAGSEGRGFALGLPGSAVSSLVLDLPRGWTPEGPTGIRRGPEPGPEADRATWRFDGPGGPIDLRLRPTEEAGRVGLEPVAWVQGPTRVEIGEATASWRADWTIDPGAGGARRLDVELDPGLEPIDVEGPGVAAFRADRGEKGTRLTIRLMDAVAGPTPVAIRAIGRVADEGAWAVPSARAIGAVWTGGRTEVIIGGARVVEACRERAGRRVVDRAEGAETSPRAGTRFLFESAAPGSVAELTFRRPRVDASAVVRGQLLLGNDLPRIEAEVSWDADRSRVLELVVGLPGGWIVERVGLDGVTEPFAWRSEPGPEGGSRLLVRPPPSLGPDAKPVLRLWAEARGAGRRGPLELPRIRPEVARPADELWVAKVEPELTLRPARARGLAWIDPTTLRDEPALGSADLRPALAWRWTADDAGATVDRADTPREPMTDAWVRADVGADRLALDWTIALGDRPGRTLVVALTEPVGRPPEWHILGEESGPPLPSRALNAPPGLDGVRSAWEIDLPRSEGKPLALRARAEVAWHGSGAVPLLVLPKRVRARGTALVVAERGVVADARVSAMHVLDAEAAGRAASAERRPEEAGPVGRPAQAFAYDAAHAGRLDLRTERLTPAGPGGVITEARLATIAPGPDVLRHRLRLRVVPASAEVLRVGLPRGARLERLWLDAQPIQAEEAGKALLIPLPVAGSGRPVCEATLDYTTPAGGLVRPERLSLSLPCLAFSWAVAPPPSGEIGSHGPALVAADAPAGAPRLGPWVGAARLSDSARASVSGGLDLPAGLGGQAGTALGDVLARWDAGRRPLVVDRMALEAIGLGPKSRVGSAADGRAGTSAASALQSMGLSVTPAGEVSLLTTPGGLSVEPRRGGTGGESLPTRLRSAVEDGRDVADRYQSVARWRGEPTPEAMPGVLPFAEGRPVRRFVALGWPGEGAEVRLVAERSRAVEWGVTALVVLLLGLASGRWPARWRSVGAVLVLALSLALAAWGSPRVAGLGWGAVAGMVACLACWLGRDLRPAQARGVPGARSGTSRRSRLSGRGVAISIIAPLGMTALASRIAADEDAPEPPIVALIPYDRPAEAMEPGGRVVLLLKDYLRLRALAATPVDDPGPPITAIGAGHSIRPAGDDRAIVETELDLWRDGEGPADWGLPVGDARELSAEVDGRAVSPRIRADRLDAAVAITGAGRHRLRFRRLVPLHRRDDGGETLSLPINVVATARVRCEGSRERVVEVASARGGIERRDDAVEGLLGPVDRLRVEWAGQRGVAEAAERGSVEGSILWDALPAGDRARVRLTYRERGGSSRVRLDLDSGWIIRSASAPGAVDFARRGTADRPEWVAHFDPPLADGQALSLELWRASSPADGAGGRRVRRAPRVEPADVKAREVVLGLRRPDGWSGSLAGGEGRTPADGQAFLRAWAPLPADGLVQAGVVRVEASRPVDVAISLASAAGTATTNAQLEIEPGRVWLRSESRLADRSGAVFEATARVPAALRVVRVAAAGLTDWSRPAEDRLRLRFDEAAAAERTVRIEGWMTAAGDPMATAAVQQMMSVPWPAWEGFEEGPGALAVFAPASVPVRLDAAPGSAEVDLGLLARIRAGRAPRLSYRVSRPSGLKALRWTSEVPKVAVSVQSQVTVHPGSAEWLASARYQVAGGPFGTLALRLPREWASLARVDVPGARFRVESTSAGRDVVWTIRLDEPAWDSLRLIVRAARPLAAGQAFEFPKLTPLELSTQGRGTVETFLALVDASGSVVGTEGTSGLQPVESSRFPGSEFPLPPGLTRAVYRVQAEGWSLRILADKAASAGGGGATTVLDAALTLTLGPDGTVRGHAVYDLGPRPGPFLAIRPSAGAEPLLAAVDGSPRVPLLDRDGRLMIPLGADSRRAEFLWMVPPSPGTSAGKLALPVPARGEVPTALTILAPDSRAVESAAEGFAPAIEGRLTIDRLGWLAGRVVRMIDRLDRGSATGRSALLSALVRFEIKARDAERALTPSADRASTSPREALLQGLASLSSTRASVQEALHSAGLDEFGQSARSRVGLGDADPLRAVSSGGEDPTPLRLRRIGVAHAFRGRTVDRSPLPEFRWSAPVTARSDEGRGAWGVALLAVVASLLPVAAAWGRMALTLFAAGLVLSTLLLGAGGPAVVAILALVGLGWAVGH